MPGGQTYGDTRVDVSGRVSCIAIDPGNSNHLLCGSAAGGVWESRDRGATWTPRTDFAPTLTVGAVAFDPANPSRAYCGTGEGNFYSGLGAGVLRSLDGGSTWTRIASAPFIGRGFYELIVDPANGNHLIAASTGGLHESADGGVNWTARRAARTWDLSMHPAGGASSEVLAACQDGLFRSTNGGTTLGGSCTAGCARLVGPAGGRSCALQPRCGLRLRDERQHRPPLPAQRSRRLASRRIASWARCLAGVV